MFDSTKEDLKDIMTWVDRGRWQLPDFQRDYVWGDDDVKSLLASIAKSFPVGALLTLQTGGEVNFKPRLLEGVPAQTVEPEVLLLDGQQRVTSLYQSTHCDRPVRTRTFRGKVVERFYYFDIKRAIAADADLEDTIIGVPANRLLKSNFGREIIIDLSTPDAEYQNDHFPINKIFDSRAWFYSWRDYWRARNRDVTDLERDFDRGIVDRIARYKMPIIRLDRNNSRQAICMVFEKVNVGGKKLDAFELVTAIYAASRFDLREDWNGSAQRRVVGRLERMIGSPNRRDVLREIASTNFLQAATLLHTRDARLAQQAAGAKDGELSQITCKRDALLALPLAAYQQYADRLEEGFIQASGFLNELKIMWHRDVPYPAQLIALASVNAILGREASTLAAKKKLERWFWSVTLGELYGSSTESRLARDVPELVDWITGSAEKPRSLDEAVFQIDRLRSLRTRLLAAYKGLHALIMQHGCRDFMTGRAADLMTFFNDQIDIHHIFPKKWCERQGIAPAVFNSIVNKTPLSKKSNISIGGNAPSVYLKKIEEQQQLSQSQLDDILRSHLIEPSFLRNDDFKGFFDSRMKSLSDLIASAMEKPVVQQSGSNEQEEDAADEDDEAADASAQEAA